MRDLFVTYCSSSKSSSTQELFTPEELYQGTRITGFIRANKKVDSSWAILSDKYGLFFPDDQRPYYELHPNDVSPIEEQLLFNRTLDQLRTFDRVWFYGAENWNRVHKLYRRWCVYLIDHGIPCERFSPISELENIAERFNHG